MPRKSSATNAPKRSDSNTRRVIGANIKARRLTLGWSQQELAERFGVSRPAVSQYEIGTGEVNAGDLPRLAQILGIGVLDLYSSPPPVQPPPIDRGAAEPVARAVVSNREAVSTRKGSIGVVYIENQDVTTAAQIGYISDTAQADAILELVQRLLALSGEGRETVRRVVDALIAADRTGSGANGSEPRT